MLNRNLRVLLLAGLVLAAAGQRDGTRRVSERSEDGTQAGEVVLSEDGSSGRVSASSVGTRRAGSSVSLTVTGDSATTRGGFATQGDSQGVSGRLTAAERRARREGREGRGNGTGGRRRRESDEPVPSMLGGSSDGGSATSASSSATVTSVASSSSSESTTEAETSSEAEASSRSAATVIDEEAEEDTEETGDAEEAEVAESSQSSSSDEAEEEIETSKPTDTSEEDSSEEAAQSSDPASVDESDAPQQSTTVASSSSGSISGEDAGVSTSVSPDPSSGGRKKICVRTQSEFEQKLKEGYEVTLVRKVSGGNVEVLREYKGPSSHSRSRIISSIIPEQIKEECDITEATLGIKKRTDGSFSSASSTTTSSHSSSSSTSGSFSSGQSSGSTSRSPRREGIFRLCSKENLKKFTGLKDICDRLLERSQERSSSDIFDIKSEFG